MGNSEIGNNVDYISTLQQEFELSYKLIRKGLGNLQKIDYSNDFYFLPLLLLSQGIERFLKSYIIAYRIENDNEELFPRTLKTHSLVELLKNIKENYYGTGTRDVDIEDEQYLSNVYLNQLLNILSDFGNNGKYYNINHLIDSDSVSPISRWEKLEEALVPLAELEYSKFFDVETRNEYYKKVSNKIVIIIEKFLSILSRQHIFGQDSKVFLGATMANFSAFECMYDRDYGKTDYAIEKRECDSDFVAHRRTFINKIKSFVFYKSKKISKFQHEDEWPFKSDSVILESRNKKHYIVIIDGCEYALNGKTSSQLKLPTPNKGGCVIGCKSTDKFLKIAQCL
ncbi:MAG: hypothetical protein IJY95_00945 [Bacteroides sp.]|nr:hypothetical protein [Bacteroides sp.]